MSKRSLMLIAILSLFCSGLILSRPQNDDDKTGKRLIDIKASVMYPIKIADSTAICLTGDVVFYHNGAVISCDSAVRYSDKHMECFRNVIINKDSTYIYGDRADYNGDKNIATVYSHLIKIIDGDAVMYTYNFRFNTLDNIGEFYGGGVMYQADNVMESERGYYFSSARQVVCVQNVEIRNSEYQMKSDSIVYDMDSGRAEFFTRSYMWNNHGDMLSADRGEYYRYNSMCYFTSDAYVLSQYRELWTDTLEYDNRLRNAEARSNVQILESQQKSMAFSDFARYIGQRGETYLTRQPSVLNFDEKQNSGDTIFMRADTIYMFVIYPSDMPDSLSSHIDETIDRYAHLRWVDTLDTARRISLADSIRTEYQAMMHISDSLSAAADSVMSEITGSLASVKSDTLTSDFGTSLIADTTHTKSLSTDSTASSTIPFEREMPDTTGSGLAEPENRAPDITTVQEESDYTAAGDTTLFDRIPDYVESDSISSLIRPATKENAPSEGLPADTTVTTAIDSTAMRQETELPQVSLPEPPEVKLWRLQSDSIRKVADSLQSVESYIRPIIAALPDIPLVEADSVIVKDSVAVDSTKNLSAKQLKKLEKQRRKQLRLEAKKLKREQKEARRRERLARRGIEYGPPAIKPDSVIADSIPAILSDSLLNIPAEIEPEREDGDTISRIIRGWHNVKMFRTDMQAVADSMVAFSVDSTMHLYIDPVIWSGENQITAEEVDMYTNEQALDRAEFTGNPIMSSKLDTVHYNQVAGKTMLARFRDGQIVRNDVNGNAQAIYYLQEDDDPALLALLVITCSNMTFEFEDQFVSYITPRVSLDWHMYPMDKIPASQQLTLGWFKWEADRRPSKSDVFSRTLIRQSQRETYEKIRKPRFSISKKIDARRKRLVESGIWADRTDPLPAHATEYIRNIAPSE